MVFVNSMSDLFHPDVSDDDIDRVFARIAAESRHTFQVLTKRPERARDYLLAKQQQMYDEGTFWFFDGRIHPRDGDKLGVFGFPNHWPLRNLWFGWTAENQEYFDKRTPVGLQVPAALHYISLEPLLESVDLSGLVKCERCTPTHYEPMTKWIDWTIIGPETGAGRRPCKLEWIESIVDQCHAAGVPVFVKALPGKKPVRDAETIAGVLHCKVADIRQFPGTVTR
jgi:protein gp37